MDRFLMQELIRWKNSSMRKPLVLNGARQVGKTWLLKEFGRVHFEKVAYVSLDNNSTACSFFEHDFNAQRMINDISLYTGVNITPYDTLIIIDEIQACPKAITALKYFCEDASEYAVAAAGSLLGLVAHAGSGYPVGKTNTFDLFPLSFREFMDATNNTALRELYDSDNIESMASFAESATALLRQYYVVGGMPGAVDAFIHGASMEQVQGIQKEILIGYSRDFSKHAPHKAFFNMMQAWESIPSHLSQENRKFVFGRIRQGARAKDFEEALTWLTQAGLITQVARVTKPGLPLSAYNDNKSFKVFLLDVGLLCAMCNLEPAAVVNGNAVFTEFKGGLTEQYVCQQLVSCCRMRPFYWSAENSIGEIDFLVQSKDQLVAIEVKAEENLRSKSLRAFKAKNSEVAAMRLSLSKFREQEWMNNVPLYAMSNTKLWPTP